jgi:mRNA interferase RelE/StbE
LKGVPRGAAARIIMVIEALGRNPFPQGTKKLSGKHDIYRLRVGNYRILYQVREKILVVLVVSIGHRREVYRRLSNISP